MSVKKALALIRRISRSDLAKLRKQTLEHLGSKLDPVKTQKEIPKVSPQLEQVANKVEKPPSQVVLEKQSLQKNKKSSTETLVFENYLIYFFHKDLRLSLFKRILSFSFFINDLFSGIVSSRVNEVLHLSKF